MPTLGITLTRALAILTIIVGLSGCASQGAFTSQPVNWNELQQQLGDLDRWHIKGKLGLRTSSDSGSLYLEWQQQVDDFDIQLSGPLGQGTTHIYGDSKQVSLVQGENIVTSNNPEQLLYQSTGWEIPVSQLHYWVRGIPTPQSAIDASSHNELGLLEFLQQDGWLISYSRHSPVEGLTLPTKMIAQRGELKLTLIVKDWRLL